MVKCLLYSGFGEKQRMKRLYEIYCILFETYGPQHWWPADSVFEMMAGAILTQNTAWVNVSRSLDNFGLNLTPEYVLNCPMDELAAIVKPSGYYNQKAARLKGLAAWFQKYGFDVERIKEEDPEKIRNELLALDGVGLETADSIMLYAFDKPYFVIDAYTKRIFSKLNYELPQGYEEIRHYFETRLPYRSALFNEYHALIIKLAKDHCKSRPDCKNCPLGHFCPSLTIT